MSRREQSVSVWDWKRTSRVAVLLLAGTVGILSRWAFIPRWMVIVIALSVPAVWIVSSFERAKPGETEQHRRQRMRNVAIALALGGLVLLFYVATMVRLGANALNPPL